MAKPAKLDTFYQVETPEGINLLFRPASPVVRSMAMLIDILLQIGLATSIIIATLIMDYSIFSSHYSMGFAFILLFLLYWWYFILFEVLNNGQSIGKRLCQIKVIHDDGTPIGWSSSILRNLLRAADLLPSFSYGLGLIIGINQKEFKRLGDIVAGTLVVYTEEKIVYQALPQVPASSSPFPLTTEEQQAILSFAERCKQLSAERRLELANILSPHFGLTPEQTEQQLYQIAQYLIGAENTSTTGAKQ